ncbi:NepR family anti-sigma factor [Methylobacterium oryzae]|uniref:Anti-sigma factor NepR domain-containing protein n=1 Tax=Methylobacterium oryzae TaxID=334852 RepID=A0ABU7TVL9_9HYPH
MSGTEDDPGIPGAADAAGTVAAAAPRDPASRPARRAGGPVRPIGDAARDRIGRGLRLHYAGVLALPVPDRLRTLLDDLAARSDTEASQ